ncbi:unnamed protein product [Didymodactylos carnosus]|uniref:Transposase n=1 Tax=Didymodactylos carnosus TaxID=1234261 RepID=A0A814HP61_9BILA|nr:unnamed protein product [Didymodactylos carnosus]CAF3784876.1 unnamed protein product [Didymodactylos carnosus]
MTMLGISKGAIYNLKKELHELENSHEKEENPEEPPRRRTRSETTLPPRPSAQKRAHSRKSYASSSTTASATSLIPTPVSPLKKGHSERSKIILSEYAKDTIRLTVHLMLCQKEYPTVRKFLDRLLSLYEDFPVRSTMTLWRWMKRIGFKYRSVNKIKTPLDSTFYMAARSKYFREIQEIRDNNVIHYFHDESWTYQKEEKRFVWTDDEGAGRLRSILGKGSRLAINAILNDKGFHKPCIEIFKCDKYHSMDFQHFLDWLSLTCAELRVIHGKKPRICLILDNARWHFKESEETKVPKRGSRQLIL